MEEPFKNYGTELEPLYLLSNISKIANIPQQTLDRHANKLNDNDIISKKIDIEVQRKNNRAYSQKAVGCKLLTLSGLKKILCAVRRPIAQHILDYYEITENNKFQCEESKWLKHIKEVFQDEEIFFQHYVQSYKLDAYFPKYNIVIEVDEYSHRSYDFTKRLERCTTLNTALKNPHYVRFDPYDTDITIYQIIGKIHRISRLLIH
jgi:very-short-patch-repair endonuclease